MADFPKFTEGSDGCEMILQDEESYIKHSPGIYFQDKSSGKPGGVSLDIAIADQKISINYQLYAPDRKVIRSQDFHTSLANFARHFNCEEELTKAMHDMKLEGRRRFIISPKLNDTGQYRIIDVHLLRIEGDQIKIEGDQIEGDKKKLDKIILFLKEMSVDPVSSLLKLVGVVAATKGMVSLSGGVLSVDMVALLRKFGLGGDIIKYPAQNNYIIETKPQLQLNFNEKTTYPAQNNYIIETKPQPQLQVDEQIIYQPHRNPCINETKPMRQLRADEQTGYQAQNNYTNEAKPQPQFRVDEQTRSQSQNNYTNETNLQPQLRLDEQTRYQTQNNYTNEAKPQPQLRLDEQTRYQAQNNYVINETHQQQKQRARAAELKFAYQVLDEGKGQAITKYQQGTFLYKKASSLEAVSFEGSPAGLALKLCPGFEDAMRDAIEGMKLNGRRMIFIPHEVTGSGENTFLELTLIAIEDLSPRSRM